MGKVIEAWGICRNGRSTEGEEPLGQEEAGMEP
jgi:hypothetical protein